VTAAGDGRTLARSPDLVTVLREAGGTPRLCAHCHDAVPTVSGIGLTVFPATATRFVLCTRGHLIDVVEDLQISLDEGPCVDAARSRAPVLADDLGAADAVRRWPRFAPQAHSEGVGAAFAFPVVIAGIPLAVLDLCRDRPGALSAADHELAVTYAAAAAVLLVDDAHRGPDGAGSGAAVGDQAARTQQATGVVMGRTGIDATAALHRLRRHALTHQVPLGDVVDDVLTGRLRLDPDR
jgi:hypothetical protein